MLLLLQRSLCNGLFMSSKMKHVSSFMWEAVAISAPGGARLKVQSEDMKQIQAFTNTSMMGAQHTSSMETSTTSTLP